MTMVNKLLKEYLENLNSHKIIGGSSKLIHKLEQKPIKMGHGPVQALETQLQVLVTDYYITIFFFFFFLDRKLIALS